MTQMTHMEQLGRAWTRFASAPVSRPLIFGLLFVGLSSQLHAQAWDSGAQRIFPYNVTIDTLTINGKLILSGTMTMNLSAGEKLIVSADGDSVIIDPGNSLNLFKIENNNTDLFTIDSVGNLILNTSESDFSIVNGILTYGTYSLIEGGRIAGTFNHPTLAGFLTGQAKHVLRLGTSSNGEGPSHALKIIAGETTAKYAELTMSASDSADAGIVLSPKGTGGVTIDVDGTPSLGDHDFEIQNGATFSEIDAGESTFTVSSSRELKTNIAKIFQSPPPFSNLNFYRFNYIDTGKEAIGMMSDEWNYIMGRKGDEGRINYHEVIIVMAAKIKELEAKVNHHENKREK